MHQRADLHSTRERICQGLTSAEAELQLSLAVAQSQACDSVFYTLNTQPSGHARGAHTPFAGLAVGVKDLYDMAGEQTLSGSPALEHMPAAQRDCPAVARLKAHGGAVLGRLAMNEFAFSGMGINPHRGTPFNPAANLTDAQHRRLPGGSSSGAGVAVATGAVFVGLGSDTGGSVRIPAAVCGVVGFKPSTGAIPTQGAVPLSTSLDTVGPLTRSVRDAVLAFECLALRRTGLLNLLAVPSLSGLRVAVPSTVMLDALEPAVAVAFERACAKLAAAGARIQTIALPQLAELAGLQSAAGLSSSEGLAWHRRAGSWARQADLDPRVVARMAVAEKTLAIDYLELQHARRDWVARVCAAIAPFDLLASPTVPMLAPLYDEVAHDDAAFFAANAKLLRNTSPINFLGAPAISLPMQAPGSPGAGLMLWARPQADVALLAAALAAEQSLIF